MQSQSASIRRVAVIGAGTCGVVAAKYLRDAGLSVSVFERSHSVGGIWVYDERRPLESPYPNLRPSIAEDAVYHGGNDADDSAIGVSTQYGELCRLRHAPPGPAYASLKNNIPTCLMSFRDHPWPDGTEEYIAHDRVLKHIESFAHVNKVDNLISLNTRVSRIVKQGAEWLVETHDLSSDERLEFQEQVTHHFDAVVVCSGHHSAPKIPDIPGLADLKKICPTRISHSKSYRHPKDIAGQNILLIGGGASAFDIAHDLDPIVDNIYQVVKPAAGNIPGEFMPGKVKRIPQIASFEVLSRSAVAGTNGDGTLTPLPTRIHLIDGQILDSVHSIVLCTGYLVSYPFLAQLHDDLVDAENASDQVLVTNGSMTHNLYKDVFYISDPTLSMVGVPRGTTSLALFEFQATVIAAVYTGDVALPPEVDMRTDYRSRLAKKGAGRQFHNLQGEEIAHVEELADWINQSKSHVRLEGFSELWLRNFDKRKAWLKEVFAQRDASGALKVSWKNIPSLCEGSVSNYFR